MGSKLQHVATSRLIFPRHSVIRGFSVLAKHEGFTAVLFSSEAWLRGFRSAAAVVDMKQK